MFKKSKFFAVFMALLLLMPFMPSFTAKAASGALTALTNGIADSYNRTADDWTAMSMSAYGRAADVAGASIVQNARTAYASGSKTDIARSIIAITALGVDAKQVYSGSNSVYLNFVEKLTESAPSQVLEAVFGLTALDSGDYADSGLAQTRQVYIDFLLSKQLTPAAGQAAWSRSGSAPDTDVDRKSTRLNSSH